MTIGERIRQAREKKGWHQAQLARAAGMAQAVLSRIENGQRQPALESIELIAKALGIAPGDLIAPGLPAGLSPEAVEELNLPPDLVRDIVDLAPSYRDQVAEYVRALHALQQQRQRQRPGTHRQAEEDGDSGEPGPDHRATARGLHRMRA